MATKPPIGGRKDTVVGRDFGLLITRRQKLKQSEAVIKDAAKGSMNFSRMSNDRLIQIAQGDDLQQKRALSRWFAKNNGMYNRAIRYLADVYKFDFMLYPNLDLDDELTDEKQKKVLQKFNAVLEHFDNSSIQLMARKWAMTVCLDGAYYGYICDDVSDRLVIQDLPTSFCRSRFYHRGVPLVEFNVQYFDKITNNEKSRQQILSLFPEEFQVAYRKYKNGKLPAEEQGDDAGWVLLDIQRAFKFNFDNSSDDPPFMSAIPALIELSEVQDLEKEKLLQQIQKVLIQHFDLDKNGQIPFTMKELQQLNQNAVDMIGDAVGVSVLSTVADVNLEDVGAQNGLESQNTISAAEDSVYNDLGISTNLFNTSGNIALEKSIITDEAYAKPLLLEFEQFFNRYLEWKFNKKDFKFRLKMLATSIFNFQTMSDKYKDLTKIGFSRFLPMVALGHTQKEVVSMAKLEQQIMQLDAYMLPPFSSNTMSSDTWSDIKAQQQEILGKKPQQAADPTQTELTQTATDTTSGESSTGGRPTLPDDQKSDKTIANQASQ